MAQELIYLAIANLLIFCFYFSCNDNQTETCNDSNKAVKKKKRKKKKKKGGNPEKDKDDEKARISEVRNLTLM